MNYVVQPSDQIAWAAIPRAVCVLVFVVLHIVALGSWATKWMKYKSPGFWAGFAVVGGAGYALLGVEMILLGYLQALRPASLLVSSGIMAASLVPLRSGIRVWIEAARLEFRTLFAQDRVIAWSCLVVLLMVVVAGIRPPREVDEREYHWAAPLLWADHGGWIKTPFHNTNGPAMGEMIYTFAAVFSSPIAAHWTHTASLLILLAGALALSEAIGGRKIAALGACLAIPVLVNQSTISYTDVAAASLVVGACVALFCKVEGEEKESQSDTGAIIAASLMFAGAVSVKSNTLAAVPMAAFYLFFTSYPKWSASSRAFVTQIWRGALLCVPVFATLCLWMVHTYVLTGDWKARQKEIASMTVHSTSDNSWHTGEAVARVPSVKDLLTLPFLPPVTPILGQREPFGGRTGLLLFLVPIGFYGIRRLSGAHRRTAFWLLAAAAFYFLTLGAIALKTRYFIFVWVAGACFASIAYNVIRENEQSWVRRWGLGVFFALMWLSMADIAHVVMRSLTPFYL